MKMRREFENELWFSAMSAVVSAWVAPQSGSRAPRARSPAARPGRLSFGPRHGPYFVEGDDPVEDAGNLQVVHADVSEDGGVRLGRCEAETARVRRGAEPQQGRRDRLVEERPVSSCRCRWFLSADVDRDVAASP